MPEGEPRFEAPPPKGSGWHHRTIGYNGAEYRRLPTREAESLARSKPGWWVRVGTQESGHYAATSARTLKRHGLEACVRMVDDRTHALYCRVPA